MTLSQAEIAQWAQEDEFNRVVTAGRIAVRDEQEARLKGLLAEAGRGPRTIDTVLVGAGYGLEHRMSPEALWELAEGILNNPKEDEG